MAAAPKRLKTIGFAMFDLVCLVHKSTAWFFCLAFWVAGLSVPANKKTPLGEPLRLGIGGSLGKYVAL